PMTFQALIDRTLAGIAGEYAYGYIDDIIIFSHTWEDHIKHVKEVLKRLQNANLRVSLPKCEWGTHSIKFLGHIFTHEQMKIDPEKVEAVQKIPDPDYKTPQD